MTNGEEQRSGQEALEAALPALRPELHRYCARMTGSVVDGEDVLQEALFKATRALRGGVVVDDLRAWLFRIAHNVAMSLFRSQQREMAMKDELGRDAPPFQVMPTHSDVSDHLRPFLALTPRQRSTCILRDVLGYSAAEVAEMTESSVPSVKSALHRGRRLLKDHHVEDPEPLPADERRKLAVYVRCFNAHEFDRLRDMLSEEVRLELVALDRRTGRKGVGGYYSNYQKSDDWLMAPGAVEGRPAMLAFDRADPSAPPLYFVLLQFSGDDVTAIRDFRYARYAMNDAQWQRFETF
ncbi:MAG: sigma-70 family RNA polymerase sigma factor [Alphaproteobacteria bacterium]|nr:sigma-70 family RNA polymerase sigma factor [Alphaproteobacteria bacterium]